AGGTANATSGEATSLDHARVGSPTGFSTSTPRLADGAGLRNRGGENWRGAVSGTVTAGGPGGGPTAKSIAMPARRPKAASASAATSRANGRTFLRRPVVPGAPLSVGPKPS